MTTETDAELIELGRKLFAGEWQFVWASPSIETLPPMAGLEVAFAGRSNVGKSSLINALTGRNALARTSHTPGRSSLARVYVLIDARHGLKDVDLDVLTTLDKAAVSYQVVLTKADQVKPAELTARIAETAAALAKHPAAFPDVL